MAYTINKTDGTTVTGAGRDPFWRPTDKGKGTVSYPNAG